MMFCDNLETSIFSFRLRSKLSLFCYMVVNDRWINQADVSLVTFWIGLLFSYTTLYQQVYFYFNLLSFHSFNFEGKQHRSRPSIFIQSSIALVKIRSLLDAEGAHSGDPSLACIFFLDIWIFLQGSYVW